MRIKRVNYFEEKSPVPLHRQFLPVPDGGRNCQSFPGRPYRSLFRRDRSLVCKSEGNYGITGDRCDITGHRSKNVDEFAGEQFDHVITLCGDARDKCPIFSGGGKLVHIGFADPAKAVGTEEEIMAAFRRVRDEIKDALLVFFAPK